MVKLSHHHNKVHFPVWIFLSQYGSLYPNMTGQSQEAYQARRWLAVLRNGFFAGIRQYKFTRITIFCCSESISECRNGFNVLKNSQALGFYINNHLNLRIQQFLAKFRTNIPKKKSSFNRIFSLRLLGSPNTQIKWPMRFFITGV